MKFFVSARMNLGLGWYAEEIDAEHFDHALFLGCARAAVKFGDADFRMISVVEVPELAWPRPIGLRVSLERAA